MSFMIPKLPRAVFVPALAALFIVGHNVPAGAEGGEEAPVEARDQAETEGFVPPLMGAPEKRMGAASRELGRAKLPCPEVATDENEAAQDCVEETSVAPATQDGEAGAPQ